jgi:hypothetical protein
MQSTAMHQIIIPKIHPPFATGIWSSFGGVNVFLYFVFIFYFFIFIVIFSNNNNDILYINNFSLPSGSLVPTVKKSNNNSN